MDTSVTSAIFTSRDEIYDFLMGESDALRPVGHPAVAEFINAKVKSYAPRLKYLPLKELQQDWGPRFRSKYSLRVTPQVPGELQAELGRTRLVYICWQPGTRYDGRDHLYLYMTRYGAWLWIYCSQFGDILGWSWARDDAELAVHISAVNAKTGDQTFGIKILKGLRDAFGRARDELANRDKILDANMQLLLLDAERLSILNSDTRKHE